MTEWIRICVHMLIESMSLLGGASAPQGVPLAKLLREYGEGVAPGLRRHLPVWQRYSAGSKSNWRDKTCPPTRADLRNLIRIGYAHVKKPSPERRRREEQTITCQRQADFKVATMEDWRLAGRA